MRNVIDLRRPPGSIPIEDIRLDAKSRDSIPALLIGLQAIYANEATRAELFRLLDAHILPGRRRDTGRPGMALWAVLVMGIPEQGLRCDTDRLRELADKRGTIRLMLGRSGAEHPGQRRAHDAGAASEGERSGCRDGPQGRGKIAWRSVGRAPINIPLLTL